MAIANIGVRGSWTLLLILISLARQLLLRFLSLHVTAQAPLSLRRPFWICQRLFLPKNPEQHMLNGGTRSIANIPDNIDVITFSLLDAKVIFCFYMAASFDLNFYVQDISTTTFFLSLPRLTVFQVLLSCVTENHVWVTLFRHGDVQ
jgi:hypothetical protein